MTDTNEGWYFEGPDPSVGIFGDLVVHEDCRLWDTVNDFGAEVTSDTRLIPQGPLVDVITTWTCACGATTVTREQEPADHFEENR